MRRTICSPLKLCTAGGGGARCGSAARLLLAPERLQTVLVSSTIPRQHGDRPSSALTSWHMDTRHPDIHVDSGHQHRAGVYPDLARCCLCKCAPPVRTQPTWVILSAFVIQTPRWSTGCCKTSGQLWKPLCDSFLGVFFLFFCSFDCQLWAIFHFGTLWA